MANRFNDKSCNELNPVTNMSQNISDTILKNLLDGVLIVDSNGVIIYANKAAEILFDRTHENLCGHPFGFPVNPYEVQELEVVRKDKILTVQMLATGIRWNNSDACLLSIRDITELKNTSLESTRQKDKLESVNKDLEQYASLASHDLKEPVRKIITYTDRLLNNKSYESVQDVKEDLDRIFRSANRMYSLINGIAEYSRFQHMKEKYVPVDLNLVVKEVLYDLEMNIAEKSALIKCEDLPTIEAIKIQMHQLFLNIISNAIKYSREDVPPEIFITHANYDYDVEITVSDNGIGFDEKYATRVFQPFTRLQNKGYEGSGIGLAICKKIVNAHGGEIKVKSIPGAGSQFTFTLEKYSQQR